MHISLAEAPRDEVDAVDVNYKRARYVAPRCPVVLFPPLTDAGEIILNHVDLHQLDATATIVGTEREGQGGVQVRWSPMG